MMSVHDALQAWQEGEISTVRAMMLAGARDVLEMYAIASACGVEIRLCLTAREAEMVARVTQAIERTIARGDPSAPADPTGAEAA